MFRSVLALSLAFVAPTPFNSGSVVSVGISAPAEARGYCGVDSYVNVRGHCVHRPTRANRAPPGASAKCRDGTYSFSESRRGTCSWHGGVAQWLYH